MLADGGERPCHQISEWLDERGDPLCVACRGDHQHPLRAQPADLAREVRASPARAEHDPRGELVEGEVVHWSPLFGEPLHSCARISYMSNTEFEAQPYGKPWT